MNKLPNIKDSDLFANMEYGPRLDCQKNPKALNNSACKFFFPCQAHTKPEQIVKLFVCLSTHHLFQKIYLSKDVTALSSWNWVSPPSVRAEAEIIRCR